MRSGGGTKSAPPCAVTRATKPLIACFAAPSFHEGSGSDCAGVPATQSHSTQAKASGQRRVMNSTGVPVIARLRPGERDLSSPLHQVFLFEHDHAQAWLC